MPIRSIYFSCPPQKMPILYFISDLNTIFKKMAILKPADERADVEIIEITGLVTGITRRRTGTPVYMIPMTGDKPEQEAVYVTDAPMPLLGLLPFVHQAKPDRVINTQPYAADEIALYEPYDAVAA